jgi:hypothetical protein
MTVLSRNQGRVHCVDTLQVAPYGRFEASFGD